jgi:sugar phosphate isomerase/epimerase
MSPRPASRRRFLEAASLATIAGLATASRRTIAGPRNDRSARSTANPIRLGGPVFGKFDDPEELARAHRQLGYGAAYCPGVTLSDPARVRATAEAFARHDVVIAEVGRWVNLLDADPARRAVNLRTVTDGLGLADEIGARCCVDIAGSFSTKEWYGPHPDNLSSRFFDAAVENARKIIDAVKPKRARFAYEMMGWALPDGPDSYRKMIRAVDRKAFAVHLDPCNLVNSPGRFYRNTALLDECFDTLGQWIVSCHAKDLVWDVEMNVHFREVRPGAGSMDYDTYLRRLTRLPHGPPLMLEHLPNPEEYDLARRHLLELGGKLGLTFA